MPSKIPTSSKVPSRQVVVEEVADRVVGDREVGPAVLVIVQRHDAQPLARRPAGDGIRDLDPGSSRDVGERPVALVAIEPIVGAEEVERGPVGASQAGEAKVDLEIDGPGPAHIVHHEEVEVTVAVIVEEGGAAAPGVVAADPGVVGDVRERPPTLRSSRLRSESGEVDVLPAVAVIVPHRHAHAVEVQVQASRLGDVGEVALTVVCVEGLGGPGIPAGL